MRGVPPRVACCSHPVTGIFIQEVGCSAAFAAENCRLAGSAQRLIISQIQTLTARSPIVADADRAVVRQDRSTGPKGETAFHTYADAWRRIAGGRGGRVRSNGKASGTACSGEPFLSLSSLPVVTSNHGMRSLAIYTVGTKPAVRLAGESSGEGAGRRAAFRDIPSCGRARRLVDSCMDILDIALNSSAKHASNQFTHILYFHI